MVWKDAATAGRLEKLLLFWEPKSKKGSLAQSRNMP